MSKIVIKEIDLDGRKLKLETGKLARQANAAVLVSLGETVVLVTVATKPLLEDPGYFPLSVEYVEKYYAGGRITAQRFIKRETRPSDKAILAGRAIDRSVRPLFPKDFHQEVQLVVTILSFDGVNDPAIAGLIGASAALAASSVPWAGPIGVARIGRRNGSVIVNPDLATLEELDLDLLVASTKSKVVMIEAEGREIADQEMVELIKTGHQQAQAVVDLIDQFTQEVGQEKQVYSPVHEQIDEQLLLEAKKVIKERIEAALFDQTKAWHEATGEMIKQELAIDYAEKLTPVQISGLFDQVAKQIMNETVLKKGRRVDSRTMDQVREISIETGVLPRTHGSAIFARGETQVLSVVTLGPLSASQTLEGMEGEAQKRFMHHYNMSINPFATGEVKKIGSPNRRDIGHGGLVERSLLGVLPSEDDFPYAIRVVSEVLSANASTSMASVCAATLALLNAGVPIKPVAGIALGLVSASDTKSDQKFQVITDMQAVEDFYGEMDFKVAGTRDGITGMQMDTKLDGLTFEIIEQALSQSKAARELILDQIQEIAPKEAELSQYAPKIEVTHIKPEDIGTLIGPGGKNINSIIAKTGAQIDIEDDGTVMVSSIDRPAIAQALQAIEAMFKKVEVGEEFDGKVVKLAPFGAFVEILPGKDGLVHVSQMAPHRVERPEDVVSEGQTVHVRVTDVDSQGKIGLSMLFGEDRKPDSEARRGARPHFARSNRFDRGRGPGRPRFERRGPPRSRHGFGR